MMQSGKSGKSLLRKLLVILLAGLMMFGAAGGALAKGGKDFDHRNAGKHRNDFKNAKVEIKITFKDLKDVAWAQRHIAKLAADRVFDGYDDGTFRPNQPVSRIEAIIASVRMMGLRDEAEKADKMRTDLNFKDADLIKRKYPNAVGYVAVALENALFFETDTHVQPEKPADRLWAAMLLVKAMKLEDEAKERMNAKLPFKDAGQVPAGAVGYVALALEKGLISGYEDLTFRPNKPVTRAELAALLGRMDDQLPDKDDDTGIGGKVTAAVYNNVLTLTRNGEVKSYIVDPNAFIFRNGARITADGLKVGDEVKAKAYNNVIIFIEVTKPATDPAEPKVNFTETGKFQYLTLNNEGKIATIAITQTVNDTTQLKLFNVASNVKIDGNAALLVPNRTIVIKGVNQLVTEIEIK